MSPVAWVAIAVGAVVLLSGRRTAAVNPPSSGNVSGGYRPGAPQGSPDASWGALANTAGNVIGKIVGALSGQGNSRSQSWSGGDGNPTVDTGAGLGSDSIDLISTDDGTTGAWDGDTGGFIGGALSDGQADYLNI